MKKIVYYLIVVVIAFLLLFVTAMIEVSLNLKLGYMWQFFKCLMILNICKWIAPKIKKMLKL